MKDPEILKLNGASFRRLISAKEIDEKVAELAKQIRVDMGNAEVPVFLCVLKGAFVFAADLVRNYEGLCELQFLRMSSYNGANTTGKVTLYPGLDGEMLKGRRVVVVEDIVDTGYTMRDVLDSLHDKKAASVQVCALLCKPDKLKVDINLKYLALNIPNGFIVGYGLDYDGFGRNTRDIYKIVK